MVVRETVLEDKAWWVIQRFILSITGAKYAIKRRYSSDLEVHIKNTSI